VIERQELYCHDCGKYVQFNLDLSLNGNHILNCPNCGHEHCRVVKDGKITSERWDSRNNIPFYQITGATISATSTWDIYSVGTTASIGSNFLYNSWMNAATGT